MVIWSFSEPHEDGFARAIRLGEWGKDADGRDIRISPLVIEWQSSSMKIGEVTIVGFGSDILARKEFLEKLSASGVKGYKEGPVLVNRTKKKRIPPPETDQELVEILPEAWVDFHKHKSSVRETKDPSGNLQFEINGTERYESYWDPESQALVRRKIPRQPGSGLLIPGELFSSPLIFRVRQFPTFLCCTDDTKNIMESLGVTNVDFLEIGETT